MYINTIHRSYLQWRKEKMYIEISELQAGQVSIQHYKCKNNFCIMQIFFSAKASPYNKKIPLGVFIKIEN